MAPGTGTDAAQKIMGVRGGSGSPAAENLGGGVYLRRRKALLAAEQSGGGARVRVRGCWGSRGATYRAAGNLGVRAQGNHRENPGELNAGGRCGRKEAALTRGAGLSAAEARAARGYTG